GPAHSTRKAAPPPAGPSRGSPEPGGTGAPRALFVFPLSRAKAPGDFVRSIASLRDDTSLPVEEDGDFVPPSRRERRIGVHIHGLERTAEAIHERDDDGPHFVAEMTAGTRQQPERGRQTRRRPPKEPHGGGSRFPATGAAGRGRRVTMR